MPAGRLRHFVRIDASLAGGAWAMLCYAYAEIFPQSEGDSLREYRVTIRSSPTARLIRASDDLRPTHRIVWNPEGDERTLHVFSVLNLGERNALMELLCRENVNA